MLAVECSVATNSDCICSIVDISGFVQTWHLITNKTTQPADRTEVLAQRY